MVDDALHTIIEVERRQNGSTRSRENYAEVAGAVVAACYGNAQLGHVGALDHILLDVVGDSHAAAPELEVAPSVGQLVGQEGVVGVVPVVESLILRIEQRAAILSLVDERRPALLACDVHVGLVVLVLEGEHAECRLLRFLVGLDGIVLLTRGERHCTATSYDGCCKHETFCFHKQINF